VHLAQIAPPFLRAVKNIGWTDEKADALTGFMLVILANPGAMEQCLLQFFSEMSQANTQTVALQTGYRETFNKVSPSDLSIDTNTNHSQVIQLYKSMIPNFDAFLGGLPADQQARFRELYSV
jgi:transportin-1